MDPEVEEAMAVFRRLVEVADALIRTNVREADLLEVVKAETGSGRPGSESARIIIWPPRSVAIQTRSRR